MTWIAFDHLITGLKASIGHLGNNISSVEHATSHVFSMTWIAFDHLITGLKASIGHLSNRQLLMVSLLSRDDWCIGNKGKMNPRIRHQVSLELSQINIEGTIKTE